MLTTASKTCLLLALAVVGCSGPPERSSPAAQPVPSEPSDAPREPNDAPSEPNEAHEIPEPVADALTDHLEAAADQGLIELHQGTVEHDDSGVAWLTFVDGEDTVRWRPAVAPNADAPRSFSPREQSWAGERTESVVVFPTVPTTVLALEDDDLVLCQGIDAASEQWPCTLVFAFDDGWRAESGVGLRVERTRHDTTFRARTKADVGAGDGASEWSEWEAVRGAPRRIVDRDPVFESSFDIHGDDGTIVTPFAELTGAWDFEKTRTVTSQGLTPASDVSARAELGASARTSAGTQFSGSVFYDGVGVSRTETLGGKVNLSLPLN